MAAAALLSQKEAVYIAIEKVLQASGKTINPDVAVVLEKKERDQVVSAVVLMFKHNKIELSESSKTKYMTSDHELMKYAKSLVTNWMGRDKRLNGENGIANDRFASVINELHYIKSKLSEPSEIKVMDDVISEYIDVSLIPSTVLEGM
jgi:hypothetical protein